MIVMISAMTLLAACENPSERFHERSTPPEFSSPDIVPDRVFFDFDSSILSGEGQETLHKQATYLRRKGLSATIEGHCDERGTREYNIALGERRAAAAKNYLVSLGVPASHLQTISYGKERPAVTGSDEAAWAQNRRADISYRAP